MQVGNNVSSVIRNVLTVKKLCLHQKRCLDELTKQYSALQQQTHTLVKKNVSLQKKLKTLEDLNKNYSNIINDLSFDEDNDPRIPTTPEKSTKHKKRNPKNEEQILKNILTPDTPRKRKKQRNDNQQLRRSVRMKVSTSTKKK